MTYNYDDFLTCRENMFNPHVDCVPQIVGREVDDIDEDGHTVYSYIYGCRDCDECECEFYKDYS